MYDDLNPKLDGSKLDLRVLDVRMNSFRNNGTLGSRHNTIKLTHLQDKGYIIVTSTTIASLRMHFYCTSLTSL